MRRARLAAGVVIVAWLVAGAAGATTVTSFDSSFVGPGRWYTSDMRGGGTASIVDLTGLGGDLENNAPLPIGAAKLTTGFDNADKAEVAVDNAYGTVSDILGSLSLGYSYHKAYVAGGSPAPAPALRLAFWNETAGKFGQLVYEPYWNQPGYVGSSHDPPLDEWTDVTIDQDTGVFWTSGGFGQSNSFGGPPLRTLAEWSSVFDADFPDAELVRVSVGVGSYNQGQAGYFDNVQISHQAFSESYDFDFEGQVVPEPSTFVIASLLGTLAVALLWRTRRKRVS